MIEACLTTDGCTWILGECVPGNPSDDCSTIPVDFCDLAQDCMAGRKGCGPADN